MSSRNQGRFQFNANWQPRCRSLAGVVCLTLLLTGGMTGASLWTPQSIAQAQTVPAEVRRGYSLLSQGWVNDAIAAFRQAIQRYPQSVEARLGLAIALRRAGRDGEAFRAYQEVLTVEPNNQLALRTIGILGGFRPEWQQTGIAALTRLLNLNPNDADARAQRALLYGYEGRFAESLADYELALQGNPTPDVLLGAAQIYTYSGNPQRGVELFNRYRAATNKPITGNAAIAYARALRQTGNAAQAIQVLQSQLPRQTNAAAIQIRSELSQTYLANGQPTQALAVLDPLRGREDAQLALARALNELGRQQNLPALSVEAAGLYRRVLSRTPTPPASLLREAADVLSGVPQERQAALQLYRQLAQQQPNDRGLAIQLLALESQAGTISRAELRQRLRPLLQPLPQEPSQRVALAQALVRLEPDPEFLPFYQSLIQAGVANAEPFLYFRLAQVQIEQNALTEARNTIATYQATAIGSRDSAPELLLAEIDRRQGNLVASAQRYETLLGGRPSDPAIVTAALRGLAGIRLAQNRPQDALALYDQLVARNPQDAQFQLGRASVAYQANRISLVEAEAALNNWLQTRPSNDLPPELYSLVAALPPDPRREALYNTLIEADPTNVPVQIRLVQVLVGRDPLQAQARVNQLLARVRAYAPENRSNVSLLFLQGQLSLALGNLDEADRAYRTILAVQPDNADALSALGGVRFRQRQLDEASQLYTQVLRLRPEDVTAQRSLAELTLAQGRPLEALERFEQIRLQQGAAGIADSELNRRTQQIQEDFLKQRGFQPPWERY